MPEQDAISEFMALPRDQQLSTLQKLSPEKQDKLLGEIRKRKAAPAPSSEQRTFGNYAGEVIGGIGRGVKDDVAGVYQTVRHPIDTATALLTAPIHEAEASNAAFKAERGAGLPAQMAAGTLAGLEEAPIIGGMVRHAEEGNGNIASPESVGASAEAATAILAPDAVGAGFRALKNTAATARDATVRGVTKTGPRFTREEAAKTATANEKAATAHEAKAAPLREKAQGVEAVNQADRAYKPRLQAAYEKTKAEANAKYAALNEKLGELSANGDFLPDAVVEAAGKIRGSETEPTILKDMEKKLKRGEVPTYNDLQGYRTEIGRELQRNLPDDVYYAYKGLQESITNEMGRLADTQGMGEEFGAARDFYKRYAQAFLDKKSPLRKVLNDPEQHGLLKRFRDKEVSGVDALKQFDPELAGDIQKSLGTMEDVGAPRGRSPLPAVEVPEAPVKKVLTPEKVTAAKQAKAIDTANKIRNSSNHLATVFVVIDGITAAIKGSPTILAAGIAGRATYAIGKAVIAHALESPKVLEAVGRITPEDVREVMKLPEDQRAGFDELLNEAQARGAKLKPGVMAAVVGVQPGPKTRQLRDLQQSAAR